MSSEEKNISVEKTVKMPAWFDNTGPDTDVITSTRIRLARNLVNHRFPFSATTSERKKIFEEVTAALKKSAPRFRNFELVNFSGLKKLEQMYLIEERIASPDMLKIDGDRGVAFDSTGRINIMINEEDHIRMQCLDSGFRPDQIWKILDLLDDTLGERLDFAFNQQLGFLTCCPTNSGTGMRVSFLMHLPGLVLTKAIDALLLGVSQMGISTRGFFGEHSDVVGNYFQLSNQATMGAHEQDFIQNTQKIICDVISHERKARERILKDAKLELSDKVFRAYGILTNARTLSLPECLNLTSAVRVGIDCGLFDLITIEELNRITLLAMPAHLQVFLDNNMGETELGVARADLVRELLTKRKRRRNTSRS
jgi:protein arginine kinase